MLLYVHFSGGNKMRHRKRLHRRELKRQRKIIVLSLFTVLLCLSIGYAAFSTNINMSARGNVYKVSDKCYETSDNEDGTVTITDYDKTCGREVNIPSTIKGKTVTKIGDTYWNKQKSFDHKSITKVTIPDTITYIGAWSFSGNSISELNLGTGVEEIGAEAFHENLLTTITFPASLKKINEGAFLKNYLTYIPVLDNIKYGSGAFSLNSLEPENAIIYNKNEDGSIDYTSINSYATRKWVDVLNVPSGVKTLQYMSFRFANVGTINLPNSIEIIKRDAFHQAKATIYNIPSSIREIETYVFNEDDNITINIDRKADAIAGAPWGATNATVNWTGTN